MLVPCCSPAAGLEPAAEEAVEVDHRQLRTAAEFGDPETPPIVQAQDEVGIRPDQRARSRSPAPPRARRRAARRAERRSAGRPAHGSSPGSAPSAPRRNYSQQRVRQHADCASCQSIAPPQLLHRCVQCRPTAGDGALDQNERQVIDELFGKLQQLDQQSPQRDAEAEAHIRQQVANLPAAPYYMAQAILVQEQALGTLQNRVQELEQPRQQRPAAAAASSAACSGRRSRARRRPAVRAAQGPIPQQYMQQRPGCPARRGRGRPGGGLPRRGDADGGGRGRRHADRGRHHQRLRRAGPRRRASWPRTAGRDEPAHSDAGRPRAVDEFRRRRSGHGRSRFRHGRRPGYDVESQTAGPALTYSSPGEMRGRGAGRPWTRPASC